MIWEADEMPEAQRPGRGTLWALRNEPRIKVRRTLKGTGARRPTNRTVRSQAQLSGGRASGQFDKETG